MDTDIIHEMIGLEKGDIVKIQQLIGKKIMGKVFIIGNGFDLDLKLKTKYIDFWQSEQFAEYRKKYSGLIYFLNSKANDKSTWFDIESLIREYVHTEDNYAGRDKLQFEQIRNSLAAYLENEVVVRKLSESSFAAQVLRVIVEVGFESIYSFNYTDLHKIAEKLVITQHFDYRDIHGRSSDSSLILGINDTVNVVDNYEFAYKTFSPYYHSVPIKFDLEDADDVVIFGLAMGDIDYPYFQDFFRNLCDPENNRKNAKRVTIFTYDESSRMDILRQLRVMNEKRVNYMFGQNEFEFIRTGVEEDKPKLTRFIKRLQDEVKTKQMQKEQEMAMN